MVFVCWYFNEIELLWIVNQTFYIHFSYCKKLF